MYMCNTFCAVCTAQFDLTPLFVWSLHPWSLLPWSLPIFGKPAPLCSNWHLVVCHHKLLFDVKACDSHKFFPSKILLFILNSEIISLFNGTYSFLLSLHSSSLLETWSFGFFISWKTSGRFWWWCGHISLGECHRSDCLRLCWNCKHFLPRGMILQNPILVRASLCEQIKLTF